MMKVTSKEKFNTSLGTTFVLEGCSNLQVGQKIEINKLEYCIKEIVLPSTPNNNLIAVIV